MTGSAVRRIVIVGGGSSGWMAAAALSAVLAPLRVEITLVESSEIGTIGVGEATLPTIRFFNRTLEIDEADFIRHTKATFKLGIEFREWAGCGRSYFHGFSDFGPPDRGVSAHQLWLATRDPDDQTSYQDFSIATQAAHAGRFAPPADDPRSVLGGYSYAYHFDAALYGNYLRGMAEARGVRRIDGYVREAALASETGLVNHLVLADGRMIEGDLFIDCSGFSGLVIDRALGSSCEDWAEWLPCDRAVAVACERGGSDAPVTRSTARDAGWQWRIPLQHRIGNGHVFCSAAMSDDEATAILLANLDGPAIGEPRMIPFRAGVRRQPWVGNCVALGLAAGFIEPLESTSIHLVESGIGRLIELFPAKGLDPHLAEEFNRLTVRQFESIRDFLVLHYHLAQGTGSAFWQSRRNAAIPAALREQVELFEASGQVAIHDADSFAEPSWLSIFFGNRAWPRRHDPLARLIGRDRLAATMSQRRAIVSSAAASLPFHADYLQRCCGAFA